MIWAILAALGVPLWLCAVGILTLLLRNRALRKRPGNVPVRVRRAGKSRWSPGHGVWIHDVFAFRGLPAAWKEALVWATDASTRPANEQEREKLHRIGDEPVIVTLTLQEGEMIELATRPEHKADLMGPFAPAAQSAALAIPAQTASRLRSDRAAGRRPIAGASAGSEHNAEFEGTELSAAAGLIPPALPPDQGSWRESGCVSELL